MVKFILYCGVLLVSVNNYALSVERYADQVLVKKSERQIQLLHKGEVYKTYKIRLGGQPLGHKRKQGDRRTPEGRYVIDFRNPESKFTLSLHINYPLAHDRLAAQERGDAPGGDIYIHGQPNGSAHLFINGDWTDGCIALSNKDIRDFWKVVKNGTPIEIRP